MVAESSYLAAVVTVKALERQSNVARQDTGRKTHMTLLSRLQATLSKHRPTVDSLIHTAWYGVEHSCLAVKLNRPQTCSIYVLVLCN